MSWKAAVNDADVKRFGSGWTWLLWAGTGLAVLSTPNQDSPISDSKVPLLGIDVWEHAYYLKYPEPPPRLPRRLVERRQLAGGRPQVSGGGRPLSLGQAQVWHSRSACQGQRMSCGYPPPLEGLDQRGKGRRSVHLRQRGRTI